MSQSITETDTSADSAGRANNDLLCVGDIAENAYGTRFDVVEAYGLIRRTWQISIKDANENGYRKVPVDT